MKKRFLVVSDYGQGAVWALVRADSEEQIRRLYPELDIAAERPGWMSDEVFARLEALETDIDHPRDLLEAILQERKKHGAHRLAILTKNRPNRTDRKHQHNG